MAQRNTQRVSPASIIPTVTAAPSANWTLASTSNLVTLNKAAGAETSILYVPSNFPAEVTINPFDLKLGKFDIEYAVGVADLTSAPTVVISRVTMAEATGVRTRATETAPTVAFVGTNTVGLAVGTYVMTVTPAAGLAHLENNEELWFEISFVAPATTTLKVGQGRIWLAPAS